MSIPTVWSPTKNVRWKFESPGGGNSSPVTWGTRLFFTSAASAGGNAKETFVTALDTATGKELWRTVMPILDLPARTPSPENGWASPTPACNDRFVVVAFATGTIACLDHEGKLLWSHNLGPLEHLWGLAASPIVNNKHAFYLVDQGSLCPRPSYLVALDLVGGAMGWRK